MHWKTKRLIGTFAWACVPFFAMAFVTFDPLYAILKTDGRYLLLVLTSFFAGAAYTFPGWRYK